MESYFAVTSAASQRAIPRMPGLEDRRACESWLTEASAGSPSADVHVGGVPRSDPWSTPAATARRTITPTINPAMNPPRALKTTEYAAHRRIPECDTIRPSDARRRRWPGARH